MILVKKNILVYPCGSEIALEIHRSLRYSRHFNLIGINSVDDHGKFVYENYIGNAPFVDSPNLIEFLKEIIIEHEIDIIYPAMDSVITKLKQFENELGCIVIGSETKTNEICLSKEKTYNLLKDFVKVPTVYTDNFIFPVFAKPKIGYGSRGAKKINSQSELDYHKSQFDNLIITEYLSGEEFTVDCLTDKNGNLKFAKPRVRNRISNGISVNTFEVSDADNKFNDLAVKINNNLNLQGAWFFQLKKNNKGDLVLLEIASRLGGSSSLYRNIGVNFAMLTVFDALGLNIDITLNNYSIILDRALNNKYKTSISYNEVFIDFDDCLILDDKYFNLELIKFIFQCKNKNVKTTLLSRHMGNLRKRLEDLKVLSLFDRIIHIEKDKLKSNYIDNDKSIFIDDSFSERKDVLNSKNIPVFSPDMIECLIE